MVFLSWFLGLLALALLLGLKGLIKNKKDKLAWKSYLLGKRIPALAAFATSLLFAILFFFLFPNMNWGYGTLYFFAFDLLFFFFPFLFFFKKEKQEADKKEARKKIIVSSLLLFGLLFEAFYFNKEAYRIASPSVSYSSLSTNSSISGKFDSLENGDIRVQTNSYIDILNDETSKENIRLSFSEANEVTIEAKVYYTLDGKEFIQTGSYKLNGLNENFNVLSLGSGAKKEGVQSYRVSFSFTSGYYASGNSAILTSITFNSPLSFYFSPLRYGVYALSVLFFAYLPSFIKKAKRSEPNKIPYLVIGGIASVFLVVVSILVLASPSSFTTSYPIDTETLHAHYGTATGKTDIFVSMFDAFRKGRIDLDLEVDSKLLALTNPWDPTERSASGAKYYWDHAFYNGKYYSYYGPAPVILVSFPFYFLSGCNYVLTAFGLEVVGMAILVPAFLLLLLEIFRTVQKQVRWGQYVFFAVIGLVTTMMISAITFKDGSYHEGIYHVPDIYGLAFFDLFFFFVLRAYREEKRRGVQLGFAGFFFVCLVFTRPNLFLGVILALPFLLALLLKKDKPFGKRILSFVPMFAILVVGGALCCVYNYARFDSIIEFGQSYQLNVTDQRHLTYSFEKLLPTFFHFYTQGGNFYDAFPFLSCTVKRYDFETKALAPYVSSYYGLMGVPLFWLTFLTPYAFHSNERKALTWFGWIFPFFLFLFAFTTYSKAGICPRYLIEFYHLATLGSFFALLQLEEKVKEKPAENFLHGAGYVLLLVGGFVCLCLSFDSFDGMKEGNMGGFLLLFKQVFHSYNV